MSDGQPRFIPEKMLIPEIVDFSEIIKEVDSSLDAIGKMVADEAKAKEAKVVAIFKTYDAPAQAQAMNLLAEQKAKIAKDIASLTPEDFDKIDGLNHKLEKIESLQRALDNVIQNRNIETATAHWAKKAD